MIYAQATKLVSITPPAAIIDDGSATTAQIDTNGFDYLEVVVYLGATDVSMTALAITESDSDGSGHVNITGLISGTSTNTDGNASVLPSATDDNKFQRFQIDLRGRKRFIDVTATIGDGTAGTFIAIWGVLSRAEESPSTMAEMGADEVLRV